MMILPSVAFIRSQRYGTRLRSRFSCAYFLPDFKRLLVQRDRLGLALELLGQRNFHLGRIDVQQLAHDADVNHVGQQLAQPRIGSDSGCEFRERNREENEVFAELIQLERFFVDHDAVRLQRHHVFARRFRIHRDEEIDFFSAGDPSVFIGANRKPGRQAGNIGRKEILAADGNPHLKNRSHEDAV